MDIISHITNAVSRGEAIRANGPIEHWLTTLATGFWGFDDSKKSMWSELKAGDVLIFQAASPNWDFVETFKPKPHVSGFIGAGVVDQISTKSAARWLSEVVETVVHKKSNPKFWPNLVHFSDVIWFGDVDDIPELAVQSEIESCVSNTLNLRKHIENLAKNKLSFKDMKRSGFTCTPMGTGLRLKKNAEVLAGLIGSLGQSLTHRMYSQALSLVGSSLSSIDPASFSCLSSGRINGSAGRFNRSKARPKFVGNNKDYIKEAIANRALGQLGESIVLAAERKRVLSELGANYVAQVVHVSRDEGDGAGYDIRTVRIINTRVVEYYLEVKATAGVASTDFFISENEIEFARINVDNYEVVRLYSVDAVKGEYKEFRLCAADLLALSMTPIGYRVSLE